MIFTSNGIDDIIHTELIERKITLVNDEVNSPNDAEFIVGLCRINALFGGQRNNWIVFTISKSIMEDFKPESVVSFGYSFFLENNRHRNSFDDEISLLVHRE